MDMQTWYRRLRERYGNGDMDRRSFLASIGTIAAAAGAVGTGLTAFPRFARATDAVMFDGYGGTWQQGLTKNIFQPFTAKTGIKVNEGVYAVPEDLVAKLQAGNIKDHNFFWATQETETLRFLRLGYLEQLDETKIPRLKGINPKSVEAVKKVGGGQVYSIPMLMSGGAIGYDKERIDKADVEKEGVNILLNKKYAGLITGEDNWFRRITYAAFQSGQDPNNIKDMNAVWDKIRESKKVVVKYWRSGAEQGQLFASRAAALSDMWTGTLFRQVRQGLPLAWSPANLVQVNFQTMMALKGSPLSAFYEILDIALRPEVQTELSIATGSIPVHRFTDLASVPDVIKSMPGFDPTGEYAGRFMLDPFTLIDNASAWQREYQRVMARG